jgi:hypothetical protein
MRPSILLSVSGEVCGCGRTVSDPHTGPDADIEA